MACLQKHLRCTDHFTPPVCPWSNRTVEGVSKEMKRILRAILSELSYPLKFCVSVIPIVQASLNNKQLKWLGARATVTLFTVLPAQSHLTVMKSRQGLEYHWETAQ